MSLMDAMYFGGDDDGSYESDTTISEKIDDLIQHIINMNDINEEYAQGATVYDTLRQTIIDYTNMGVTIDDIYNDPTQVEDIINDVRTTIQPEFINSNEPFYLSDKKKESVGGKKTLLSELAKTGNKSIIDDLTKTSDDDDTSSTSSQKSKNKEPKQLTLADLLGDDPDDYFAPEPPSEFDKMILSETEYLEKKKAYDKYYEKKKVKNILPKFKTSIMRRKFLAKKEDVEMRKIYSQFYKEDVKERAEKKKVEKNKRQEIARSLQYQPANPQYKQYTRPVLQKIAKKESVITKDKKIVGEYSENVFDMWDIGLHDWINETKYSMWILKYRDLYYKDSKFRPKYKPEQKHYGKGSIEVLYYSHFKQYKFHLNFLFIGSLVIKKLKTKKTLLSDVTKLGYTKIITFKNKIKHLDFVDTGKRWWNMPLYYKKIWMLPLILPDFYVMEMKDIREYFKKKGLLTMYSTITTGVISQNLRKTASKAVRLKIIDALYYTICIEKQKYNFALQAKYLDLLWKRLEFFEYQVSTTFKEYSTLCYTDINKKKITRVESIKANQLIMMKKVANIPNQKIEGKNNALLTKLTRDTTILKQALIKDELLKKQKKLKKTITEKYKKKAYIMQLSLKNRKKIQDMEKRAEQSIADLQKKRNDLDKKKLEKAKEQIKKIKNEEIRKQKIALYNRQRARLFDYVPDDVDPMINYTSDEIYKIGSKDYKLKSVDSYKKQLKQNYKLMKYGEVSQKIGEEARTLVKEDKVRREDIKREKQKLKILKHISKK